MNIATYGQMQELAGDAFKVIAEKAKKREAMSVEATSDGTCLRSERDDYVVEG